MTGLDQRDWSGARLGRGYDCGAGRLSVAERLDRSRAGCSGRGGHGRHRAGQSRGCVLRLRSRCLAGDFRLQCRRALRVCDAVPAPVELRRCDRLSDFRQFGFFLGARDGRRGDRENACGEVREFSVLGDRLHTRLPCEARGGNHLTAGADERVVHGVEIRSAVENPVLTACDVGDVDGIRHHAGILLPREEDAGHRAGSKITRVHKIIRTRPDAIAVIRPRADPHACGCKRERRQRRPAHIGMPVTPRDPCRCPHAARHPAPADAFLAEPAAIVIRGPSEVLVGVPHPAVVIRIDPAAARVGLPVIVHIRRTPAAAVRPHSHPSSVPAQRVRVVKNFARYTDVVLVIHRGGPRTARGRRCDRLGFDIHHGPCGTGLRDLRADLLIRHRIQAKRRAPKALRGGEAGRAHAVPCETVIDVIDLVRIGESAGRSGRIVLVEKIRVHRRLAVACEGKVHLPVFAGGIADIDAEIIRLAGCERGRIEHHILLGVIGCALVENHPGEQVGHRAVGLDALGLAAAICERACRGGERHAIRRGGIARGCERGERHAVHGTPGGLRAAGGDPARVHFRAFESRLRVAPFSRDGDVENGAGPGREGECGSHQDSTKDNSGFHEYDRFGFGCAHRRTCSLHSSHDQTMQAVFLIELISQPAKRIAHECGGCVDAAVVAVVLRAAQRIIERAGDLSANGMSSRAALCRPA